nr:EOG090X0F7H [Lepidurus arcticus]
MLPKQQILLGSIAYFGLLSFKLVALVAPVQGKTFGNGYRTMQRRCSLYLFFKLILTYGVLTIIILSDTVQIANKERVLYSGARLSRIPLNMFIPGLPGIVKFLGQIDFRQIVKKDGKINGFNESPVTVEAYDGGISFRVDNGYHADAFLDISSESMEVTNVERFEMLDAQNNGQKAFSTLFPNFGLPKGVQKLNVNSALVNRIVSPNSGSLSLSSDAQVRLRGNEGISMSGKEILISADQELWLKSVNGTIVLSGKDIHLDVNAIPIFTHLHTSAELDPNWGQYKLCICMPRGTLFRIPIPADNALRTGAAQISCNNVDPLENNPCQ